MFGGELPRRRTVFRANLRIGLAYLAKHEVV